MDRQHRSVSQAQRKRNDFASRSVDLRGSVKRALGTLGKMEFFDDAYQDALTALVELEEEPTSPKAWLIKRTRYRCLDRIRSEKRALNRAKRVAEAGSTAGILTADPVEGGLPRWALEAAEGLALTTGRKADDLALVWAAFVAGRAQPNAIDWKGWLARELSGPQLKRHRRFLKTVNEAELRLTRAMKEAHPRLLERAERDRADGWSGLALPLPTWGERETTWLRAEVDAIAASTGGHAARGKWTTVKQVLARFDTENFLGLGRRPSVGELAALAILGGYWPRKLTDTCTHRGVLRLVGQNVREARARWAGAGRGVLIRAR